MAWNPLAVLKNKVVTTPTSSKAGWGPTNPDSSWNKIVGNATGKMKSGGNDLPDWLKLQMSAVDDQYGGGGSGGGGGGFYSVPSIQPQMDYLKNFQATGNQNIQGAYANLNDVYNKSQAATEKTGADTTAALTKNFDASAAAQAALAQQIQGANSQQAGLGGAAGQWAGAGVSDILAAQIAANKSNIEASRASTMANQQQYAQGMADAARQAHTVSGVDQANVTGNFNTNIANQLSQLQNQYQSEVSKANAANAQSRSSSSDNSGKAAAAKEKLLASYLKSQDSDAKKAAAKLATQKDPKKGMAAVIFAAQKSGHPELVKDFTRMLGDAQTLSSQGIPVTDASGNPTGGTKAISLNNALKQILDGYMNNVKKPSKSVLQSVQNVTAQSPRFGVPKNTPVTGAFGMPNTKAVTIKGSGFNPLGPAQFLKDSMAYTSAQKKQQQLQDLYNFYTGQYGG
jgi:hypothetical protein